MTLSRRFLTAFGCMLTTIVAPSACGDDDEDQERPKALPLCTAPTLEIRPTRVFKTVGWPCAVSLSADGKVLAATEASSTRTSARGWVWQTATGEVIARLDFKAIPLGRTRLSPDGRIVVFTTTRDDKLRLFDVSRGEILRTLRGPSGGYLPFSPDGSLLASSVSGGEPTKLWQLADGKEVGHFTTSLEATAAAFQPDGKILAVATDAGSIHLLDVSSGREVRTLPSPKRRYRTPSSVAFSPDGRLLAVAFRGENIVLVWNVDNGKLVREYTWQAEDERADNSWAYPAGVVGGPGADSLAFSADGRSLIVACHCMRLFCWETASGRMRYQVEEGVSFLAAARAKGLFAATIRDKEIYFWHSSASLVARHGDHPPSLANAWSGLLNTDASVAYALMRTLMAAPHSTVALLGEHLIPAPRVESGSIERLLRDLDSDQFEVREKASRRLAELREVACPALTRVLGANPSAEAPADR